MSKTRGDKKTGRVHEALVRGMEERREEREKEPMEGLKKPMEGLRKMDKWDSSPSESRTKEKRDSKSLGQTTPAYPGLLP